MVFCMQVGASGAVPEHSGAAVDMFGAGLSVSQNHRERDCGLSQLIDQMGKLSYFSQSI